MGQRILPNLEEDDPRLTRAFWIGVLGAAAMILFGMFGAHAASVWRAPSVLRERVETALRLAGASGVEVVMRGQEARLHGVLADPDAIAEAMNAALTAAGPGGAWAGGVTGVDISGLAVGPSADPFVWRARRSGREVRLSGSVPSARAKQRLALAAAAAFPNAETPLDETQLAGGAPSARWTEIAIDALKQLATLSGGEVRLSDDRLVIIGEGDRDAVASLRDHYRAPPAPFSVRIDVLDPGGAAAPELAGLDLADGTAQTCAQAFARVMERNVINFAPGSAHIDEGSTALLNTLASVALRCDRFAIEISGHTDNEGARALNMDLSRQRAEAVRAYLAGQGVAANRLSAVGYGPDRPRASNGTPAGQAANRRIEFNVAG